MDQTSSAQSRGSAPSNFYSMSRTPTPYSGSSSRVSSVGLSSSSVQSSGSTPLSSRDTTQQLITGLDACQSSIEELLQTVRSSNEWIEELTEKVKILDGRVEKLSSHPVDGTESGSGGRGEKRKRTKSSLLVQVSLKIWLKNLGLLLFTWFPLLSWRHFETIEQRCKFPSLRLHPDGNLLIYINYMISFKISGKLNEYMSVAG